METLLVIGLFKSLQHRFSAECTQRNIRYKFILADIGKEGTMDLLPFPKDAVYSFQSWLKEEDEEYQRLNVIYLPYSDLPEELESELDAAYDLGCTINDPGAGEDGWPEILPRRNKPDTVYINQVFEKLVELLPPVQCAEISISEYYHQIEAKNPCVLFSPSVFECCDKVAPFRVKFMKQAVDALAELTIQDPEERIDMFFRKKGIEHAQTGGIKSYLDINYENNNIKSNSCMHLKRGDKTSAESAVRIYYQLAILPKKRLVIIIYAGPHPEDNVVWKM